MSRPRPVAVLVLLLSASFAWLFRGALFKGETFVERDLATFHRAAKSLVPRLVHESAGLPQWNPYYASGQPFAANPQHALFHPATALFLLLPFEWAFRLQVMLPPMVAAAALFFLLRSLGRRRVGAAFGALVWGLGGYTLSVTNLLPTLLATSVLPAVLAFAHRIAHGGGRKDVAGLGLALGLEALAGEPTTLMVTPLLLVPAVGQAILRRPGGWSRRAAGRLALGLLLGLCLASAALLPASRLAARTTRAAGLAPAMADIWSMPPFRLAEIVFPYAFGRVESGAAGFWALRFYPGQSTPFVYSLYPGLLTTVLAATMAMAAVRSRRRRRSWPALLWIGAGLVGVALAAGRYLPLWPVLRHVPPFSGVRYPERFVLVALLPLAILAAWGFDLVVHGSAGARRTTRTLLLIAGGLSAASGIFALCSRPGLWTALGLPEATVVRMPLLAAQDALAGVTTALAFLIALSALTRRRPWASAALLTLAALDLVHTGGRLMKARPVAEMTAPPPVIRDLLAASVAGPVFHAAGWAAQRELEFSFVRPPMPAFWGIATAFEPDFDLTELRWSSAATRAFLEVLEAQPRTALAVARRRGVVAVIHFTNDVKVVGGTIVKPEGAESAVELRFLEAPKPLAFLASRVEAAAGEAGWKDTVLRLGPASADTVIADSSEAGRIPAHPSAGAVRTAGRRPGRLLLDVDVQGPEPGLVAVNQTWDAFWRARVDGGEAAVLRTDLSLMAVVVPPGRHRLELTYEDPWVLRGLAVSAAAMLGLAALARPRARKA
jgi:hypothetical protein